MKIIYIIFAAVIVLLVVILLVEVLMVISIKQPTFKNPDRAAQVLGTTGEKLTYVVLGDSTGAGRGADYKRGVAIQTAKYLAKKRKVKFVNLSVSGGTTRDVLIEQIPHVSVYKPDLVLLAVGSNDVTHLTLGKSLEKDLNLIIEDLIKTNCNVKIVVTGAAEMGAIPLFPQPLQYIAGLRTQQLNKIFGRVAEEKNITFAQIAYETGPLFKKYKSLFASDGFHPNESGYATWLPVLNKSIDGALQTQPSHCN